MPTYQYVFHSHNKYVSKKRNHRGRTDICWAYKLLYFKVPGKKAA